MSLINQPSEKSWWLQTQWLVLRTGTKPTGLGETSATRSTWTYYSACCLQSFWRRYVIMKCTQKLSFSVGLKEKKFTFVLLRDQQMYQTTRSKWFKNGAEKTTSPVFFQSYWRFEPLSYLKTHITSLSSSLLIFIFCLAGHCFYRLTKHYHKTSPFFVFSPVRTFSGWL